MTRRRIRQATGVGDVLAVLDAAEIDRAHFWGYSMGGHVCYALGRLAPGRVTVADCRWGHPRSAATRAPSKATRCLMASGGNGGSGSAVGGRVPRPLAVARGTGADPGSDAEALAAARRVPPDGAGSRRGRRRGDPYFLLLRRNARRAGPGDARRPPHAERRPSPRGPGAGPPGGWGDRAGCIV